MALVSAVLANSLAPTFAGVDTFATAGNGWASAYATYALSATAGVALPAFTGLERQLLAANLTAAFALGIIDSSAAMSAMELAFQAFWFLPPVIFGTGVVSVAPPGLAALIAATFPANILAATSAEAASNIASALDTWTRTVIVTFPGGVTVTLL